MPSRRSALRTCGIALAGGVAGCLSRSDDPGESAGGTTTRRTEGKTTVTSTTETTADGAVDAHVGIQNHHDEYVTLTVVIRRGGEIVTERTKGVDRRIGTGLDWEPSGPGNYTVEARLDSGENASYDWTIGPNYRGQLRIEVDESRQLSVQEILDDPTPAERNERPGDLPYSAPGNVETFQPSSAIIRNEAGEPITLRLAISHEETTFLDRQYELAANQTVTLDEVTATAGAFSVTVEIEGGATKTADWRVPPRDNYPKLNVRIVSNDDVFVGCGQGGEVRLDVTNETDEPRTVELALLRDGDPVDEQTVDVDGNTTTDVSLSTPIGDVYTLRAVTDAGTGQAEIVDCYCYGALDTTVTLDGESPEIETTTVVCE